LIAAANLVLLSRSARSQMYSLHLTHYITNAFVRAQQWKAGLPYSQYTAPNSLAFFSLADEIATH